LEADFGLDMLALIACIITYVLQSQTCKRLMQDQGIQSEAIKHHILNKFGSFDDLDA